MKATQLKDAYTNITRQIVSFTSILIVITLGIGIFLACRFTGQALGTRSAEYYRGQHYHDLEIRSNIGITEDDITAISGIDGVTDVEGLYAMDMVMTAGSKISQVHVISATERLDQVTLEEGSLPAAENECAVVPELASKYNLNIGDRITLEGVKSSQDYLKQKEFTVTGIMRHPDHFRAELVTTYNVMIPICAVDQEKMSVPYTGALICMETEQADIFSDAYLDEANDLAAALAELSAERISIRQDEFDEQVDQQVSNLWQLLGVDADPSELPSIRDVTNNYTLSSKEVLKKISDKYHVGMIIEGNEELLSKLLDPLLEKAKMVKDGQWVILDRSSNLTWSEIRETKRIFANIGITFALMFILLGILVCYATIGKIIGDQRKLVGTTKALGFFKKEIRRKYTLFGVTASILGVIAGILLAYFIIQNIILLTISKLFILKGFLKAFQPLPVIITVIAAIAISFLAVSMSCSRLLNQPASVLLSEETPPSYVSKRRTKSNRSLYTSLILRNMRTDIKRVIVTIASIAGCCVLLVVGFSLKQASVNILYYEFNDILRFDALVTIQQEAADSIRETGELLQEIGVSNAPIHLLNTMCETGSRKEIIQVICIDPDKAEGFFHFQDPSSMKDEGIPEEGLMIFGQLAEKYDIKIGDKIKMRDENGALIDVPVGGIYNNYAGRYAFMSSAYARTIFRGKNTENTFLIRYDGIITREQLEEKLSGTEGVLNVTDMNELRVRFETTAKLMDLVILLTTVMAAIMAAVVILNLIRIQINQKKRELTVMRINGFSTRETVRYLLRENIITTCLGIVIGLGLGILASKITLSVIDRIELQMYRGFMFQPLLYSALVTIVFAAIVNYFALRKIKTLKLSDVNN